MYISHGYIHVVCEVKDTFFVVAWSLSKTAFLFTSAYLPTGISNWDLPIIN
jgi:hypothetical protein